MLKIKQIIMKRLYLNLILLLSINIYSQGFCEYGEYDFIFNTIKGVNKSSFKKIEVKQKQKSIYTENFNKKGLLIDSNYNETIPISEEEDFINLVSMDNPCYTSDFIEQKLMTYVYEHSKDKTIKKVDVYSGESLKISNVYSYYPENNKLKSIKARRLEIEHTYYKNGLLKKIDRNGKTFDFFWDKKEKLKKIILTPTDYSYDEHLLFEYNSVGSIDYIKNEYYDRVTKKKSMEVIERFCYANGMLKQITSTGISIENDKKKKLNPIFFEFDYSKKDKLIITHLNKDKKYVSHYECYYF